MPLPCPRRRLGLAGACLALALTAAACGTAPGPTTTTTVGPGPATTPSSPTPSSPTPSSPTPPSPTPGAGAGGYLSGYGATQAAWAAGHHPDPSAPAGNYWPRLPDGLDTYAAVRFVGSRALAYVENLDPPETAADARSVVGDELPPDARLISDTTTRSGERLVETSPTLKAATGDDVAVELGSGGSRYDPSRVTSLTYSAVPAASPG